MSEESFINIKPIRKGMKQDLMALATIVAIVIAFGVVFIVEPSQIVISAKNALLASFIISLSTLVMVFVIGTFSMLKERKKRKSKITDTTKLTILAIAIIISFVIAGILAPSQLELNLRSLNLRSLATANFVIQSITMIMLYVVGTLVVFAKKKK
ncbi:MAG: hypothetical protein GOV15_04180 [Candidatus Diapherotrites archaeon]|nr:hypothetical protein [Candidatus Diapherotrites archaeon]